MWTDILILGSISLAEKSILHKCDRKAAQRKLRALKDSETIKPMTAQTTELGHLKSKEAQAGLTTFQAVPHPMPGKLGQEGCLQGGRATGSGVPSACLASNLSVSAETGGTLEVFIRSRIATSMAPFPDTHLTPWLSRAGECQS